MIHEYENKHPSIHKTAFVAKDAVIVGDVTIDEYASIWFKTVIRGDISPTIIGKRVNIQDLSMLHQSPGVPLIIEDDVSVGHQVTIHSATIRKNSLIGMGSIILDGAEIGESAFIGAGSLVTPGTIIPPHTLALGSPAKVVRKLTEKDYEEIERVRSTYIERGQKYKHETNLGM